MISQVVLWVVKAVKPVKASAAISCFYLLSEKVCNRAPSRLFCAAPDGAGAVDVQPPVLDPPGRLQASAEGAEPKDPSKSEGDESLRSFRCCAENMQVSQHVKSFGHDLLYSS